MNIKKTIISLAGAAALSAGAASAANSDLLVSIENGKAIFEFVNDAKATSMQFDLELQSGDVSAVKLANCVSGVAASHAGGCNVVDGKVRVLIYSMDNTPIPSGKLGSVMIPAAQNATIGNFKMANAVGGKPTGEAFVDFKGLGPITKPTSNK